MIHLSTMIGMPVLDAGGSRVGRLRDLVVDGWRGAVARAVRRLLAGVWSTTGALVLLALGLAGSSFLPGATLGY